MKAPVDAEHLQRLRSVVARRLGLQLDEVRLADALRGALRETGLAPIDFITRIETEDDGAALREMSAALTVPETYFFRHMDQFRAFEEIALRDRLRARAAAKTLRILSVGCATGEEPYTIAMILREAGVDPAWDVSIRGVDVNPKVLARAELGRFSQWSLRETPPEARRWFRREGVEHVLDPQIRAAVRFEELNLLGDAALPADFYDVVFWRNVMMYFTPEAQREATRRVARSLLPGGYLFIGHAETLRDSANDLSLRHTHDTFYYQRGVSAGSGAALPPPGRSAAAARLADGSWAGARLADGSWADSIHEASQRIRALSERSHDEPSPPVDHRGDDGTADLAAALELLQKERYGEALAIVAALPPESARESGVRLLRAVLLAHGGRLAEAEDACHDLLAESGRGAGARYVLGLCREGAADPRSAAEHHLAAAQEDPTFAMPRLHLGLLARRAGDRDAARRELGLALALLEHEDPARVALFGGGFNRQALLALCRGELARCGGKS